MSWLNYYAGDIKAAVVLACVLGIALIGLAGISFVPGVLIATSGAAVVAGALHLVQRWIKAKSIHPIRVVNHPELAGR